MDTALLHPEPINVPIISLTVITEPLYKNLIKGLLSIEETLTDKIIDTKFSLEDLASLFYINSSWIDVFNHNGLNISINPEIFKIIKERAMDNISLNTKIEAALKLSGNEFIKQKVESSLNCVYDETSPPYAFTVLGSKIWLIIKEGFFSLIKKKESRIEFYREYLKTVSKAAPFQVVAMTDVYSHYVMELMG